jgi:flagellar biosynthesis anti-sigma factor FlgM
MKIQNGPAERARAQRAANLRAQKGYSKGADGTASGAGQGDKVVLSDDVANLAESIRSISKADRPMGASEARILELKTAIENGDYKVDPRKLAASILNSDLDIEES